MSIRTLPCLVALGIVGLVGAGSQAFAADYTTIVKSTDVAQPAGKVWKDIGGFCEISSWMKLKCAYVAGTGDLGTVRQLAGRIDEVMVAQTGHSYTIAQPATPDRFHATLSVEPAGAHKSKIVYSMVYDQSNLSPGMTKERYRAIHIKMCDTALAWMKNHVEGK